MPKFFFDPEAGSSLCIITARNKTFIGTAQCLDKDRDMMNEKTGCEIAYHRAILRSLRDYKDQLNIEIKTLISFQSIISQSKKYNPDDYTSKMLKKQIQNKKEELKLTKELIEEERQYLIAYLSDKAKFYEKIRANRKGKNDK